MTEREREKERGREREREGEREREREGERERGRRVFDDEALWLKNQSNKITIYFINPSAKLKLSFDLTVI